MENLVEAGYIVKSHGVRGDLRIRFHDGIILVDELPKAVFILYREEQLPYFTTSFSFISDTDALVHFEGLDDKESAHELKGSRIFVEEQHIESRPDDLAPEETHSLVGYDVHDRTLGRIGEVEAVESYPQQHMLVVTRKDGRILIPLRPELIPEQDDDAKRIVTDLPEGYLDI